MSNGYFSAGVRLAAFFSSLLSVSPIHSQSIYGGNPYDAGQTYDYVAGAAGVIVEPMFGFPGPPSKPISGIVSSDLLRNPLSLKARHALEKAMHDAEMGDHTAAIHKLREALVKYPASAPYLRNFLGVELIQTRRFEEAVTTFEQAVHSMPHEAAMRSNFAFALALTGDTDRAEREIRKALELDRDNSKARTILEVLLVNKRIHTQPLLSGEVIPQPE